MIFNIKNVLGYITVVAIAIAFTVIYTNSKVTKTVYIDLEKTFNEFELKKELENKLTKAKAERQNILDSLEFDLKVLSKELQAEEGKDKNKVAVFQAKRDEYLNKKEAFMNENNNLSSQFDDQIFRQLNQYVKDYGAKKDYTYILGADGTGILMYAKESEDITEDVIKYVNDKYKGNVE